MHRLGHRRQGSPLRAADRCSRGLDRCPDLVVDHLNMGWRLSGDVKAEPLIEPPGRVLPKDLEAYGHPPLRRLTQDRPNDATPNSGPLSFRSKLDAAKE